MKTVFCVLLAVLASLACGFKLPEGEGIYHLTTSNISMASTGDWLLVLYAPWCPHCHSLFEKLPELAESIRDEKASINIATIDADTEPSVQMQFSMHGFPSIFRVHEGQVYPFPARIGRTVPGLTKWSTKDYSNEPPMTGYKAPFGIVMRAFALYSAFAIGCYRFLEVYAEMLNVPPMWFFCGVAVILALLVIVLMIVTSRCRRPAKKPASQRKNAGANKKRDEDAAIAAPIVQRARAENPIEGAAIAETEKVQEQVKKAKEEQKLRRREAKKDEAGVREQQQRSSKKQAKQKNVRQQNMPTQQPSKRP